MLSEYLSLGFIFIAVCHGHYDELSRTLQRAGPQYVATKGQPWPKPQLLTNYQNDYLIVRPAVFRFEITRNTCDLLDDALKRYYKIILLSNSARIASVRQNQNKTARSHKPWKSSKDFHGYLDVMKIDLMGKCETYPHDEMDESYEIKIDTPDMPGEGLIIASTNWGMLRGLETFSQILFPSVDFTSLQVQSTLIVDYPRFSYRSILLDTSRHFLSKKVILENLDLMAMNKYNVFHWHIVDDQAFPYQSKTFPNLSSKGAYHPYTHVYTQQDIAEIIEYGRVRGIRVVPEFDTPGHTQSWGVGQPDLLTECYNKQGKPDGTYGPINPIVEENYEFLSKFFNEVSTTFADKYIHLGGDEVDFACWKSNPQIVAYMKEKNLTDYAKLEEYYMQRLVNIIQELPNKNSYLVWQEVIDNGVDVNNATIVHVWKGGKDSSDEIANITLKGYRILDSSCWYLNYISYGIDWEKYYVCDPQKFNGTEAQKRLVLGGGAAMWAEYVDSTNLIPRLWPRAALPAERLWSNSAVNNTHEAAPRLEEHRCRLLKRGYLVEPPNGPGYCLISWDN